MIDLRLFKILGKEKIYLVYLILLKFIGQFLNLGLIYCIARLISDLIGRHQFNPILLVYPIFFIVGFMVQIKLSSQLSYLMSQGVKQTLRQALFDKLYSMGLNYTNHVRPSDIAQLSVQGIEQLDIYYGSFLPQMVYALVAPIILLIILFQIHAKTAFILFLGVPLIPISIMMFQRLAKKVTGKYWGSYLDLSDIFLKFLTAMTTLKVYDADELENQRLNDYAERFRKDTMRLLYVQINNITIMDIIGYGGAAAGMILALFAYQNGEIKLFGLMVFILISAEMFLPLRQLGSLFHIAINGMSSVRQLFDILDLPSERHTQDKNLKAPIGVDCQNINFSYDTQRTILKDASINFKPNNIVSIVGESGSGKSTLAALISGKLKPNDGQIYFNREMVSQANRIDYVMLIGSQPYFFSGTVRYNLQVANAQATDEDLWRALEQVNLNAYFKKEQGLDTDIKAEAANLSGGQKQRLALARALLRDAPIYILDESTSNIDSSSEQIILNVIQKLKKDKTIIIISHRLKHTKMADYIYYLSDGNISEQGTFKDLYALKGSFFKMYDQQMALENWRVQDA